MAQGPWGGGWPKFPPGIVKARGGPDYKMFAAYVDGTPVEMGGKLYRIVWHEYGTYRGQDCSYVGLQMIPVGGDAETEKTKAADA